jgi:hypothetical protein
VVTASRKATKSVIVVEKRIAEKIRVVLKTASSETGPSAATATLIVVTSVSSRDRGQFAALVEANVTLRKCAQGHLGIALMTISRTMAHLAVATKNLRVQRRWQVLFSIL